MGISDRKKSIDVSVNINLDFNEEIRPNNFIVENNFKSGFFVSRKKSGNIIAGSKLNVEGQGIFTVKGGDNINITKHFPKPTPVSDGLKPTPTPTPTNTPTNTQTPSITPTNTPTNTQTPSITPTNTITPSVTPTNTLTPTKTPTTTPTPTTLPITNPDAYAYASRVIASGGTIDYTTATALDVLFTDLQNTYTQAGPTFYSVLEGFYPMLGLTSATQAINANGNTVYDLQLSGGWTFGSLGMQGNGINTQAYTGKDYVPITGYELDNTHFSIYGTIPNNTPSNGDLSVSGVERQVTITLNKVGSGTGRYEYDCSSGANSIALLNSGDFVTISTSGGATFYCENSGAGGGSAGTISTLSNYGSLYLGVSTYLPSTCTFNSGRSVNTFGWSSFGGFMNPTDMVNYQTIVNTFMTSIGRNTY